MQTNPFFCFCLVVSLLCLSLYIHKCIFLTISLFVFYPSLIQYFFFFFTFLTLIKTHCYILASNFTTSQLKTLTMSPDTLLATPFFHKLFYNSGFYNSVGVYRGPITIWSWTHLLSLFCYSTAWHLCRYLLQLNSSLLSCSCEDTALVFVQPRLIGLGFYPTTSILYSFYLRHSQSCPLPVVCVWALVSCRHAESLCVQRQKESRPAQCHIADVSWRVRGESLQLIVKLHLAFGVFYIMDVFAQM